MRKIMLFAACAMLAVVTQAAQVGWSLAGASSYANDKYQFFVIGQNGATSIATVAALLDAGTSVDSYAFGSGTIAANGAANVGVTASGKELGAGTYTAFYVIFDSASPTSGTSKYVVVDGASNLTKTIAATTANVTFSAGNASSILNNADNWKSFGSGGSGGDTPEPTSGLLLLVGGAMLALRRKQK